MHAAQLDDYRRTQCYRLTARHERDKIQQDLKREALQKHESSWAAHEALQYAPLLLTRNRSAGAAWGSCSRLRNREVLHVNVAAAATAGGCGPTTAAEPLRRPAGKHGADAALLAGVGGGGEALKQPVRVRHTGHRVANGLRRMSTSVATHCRGLKTKTKTLGDPLGC